MRSIPVAHVGLALGLVVCTACTGVRRDEGFVGEPTDVVSVATTPPPAAPIVATHRVARGETVWSIAVQHGTCVAAILAENPIHDVRRLHRGAELRVPDASACGAAGEDAIAHHRVRRGDTVSRLALLYGTSSRAILEANGITDARRVHAGSTLRVPLGVSARTPAPPPSREVAAAEPAVAVPAKAARPTVRPPAETRRASVAASPPEPAARVEAAVPPLEPVPAPGAEPAPTPAVAAKAPASPKRPTAEAPARVAAEPVPPSPPAARDRAGTPAPRVAALAPAPPAAVSAAPPAGDSFLREADDALDVGEHHLREAHFEEAIASVEDAFWLLDADDADEARPERARGHVIAATAYLALGDQDAARQSLVLALTEEPRLELDRTRTPPRLLELFDEVRGEQRLARAP